MLASRPIAIASASAPSMLPTTGSAGSVVRPRNGSIFPGVSPSLLLGVPQLSHPYRSCVQHWIGGCPGPAGAIGRDATERYADNDIQRVSISTLLLHRLCKLMIQIRIRTDHFMRFSSLKRFVAVLLLLILVQALIACGGDEQGAESPFRIGVMESLTGAGETYGTVAIQAKKMAMDEINAYNKLTDVDGMKIILGTSCNGAMLGVAPLAERDGVVLFSGLASNPDIANAGDYIFRTQISDIEVGINTGNVLWADGIRTLPWHLGSAYDDVYIAAECLKQIDDDQDADGFRDCLYDITWPDATLCQS